MKLNKVKNKLFLQQLGGKDNVNWQDIDLNQCLLYVRVNDPELVHNDGLFCFGVIGTYHKEDDTLVTVKFTSPLYLYEAVGLKYNLSELAED